MLAAEIVLGALLLAGAARWSRSACGGASLQRRYGTIDLSLRLARKGNGRGWVLGVGRFEGDDLQWYRVFSLAPRPRRTLSRQTLEVRGRREPRGPETLALLAGAVVMECRAPDGPGRAGHGGRGRDRLPGLARGPPAGRDPAGLTRGVSARRRAST